MKGKILVIGSLNMDIAVNVERMPLKGETVLGKSLLHNPGGKGANQAYAAGKLEGNVTMLGCIGDDSYGKQLLKNLLDVHVDVSHISIRQREPTGTAVIYVDENGENSIVVAPGANSTCTEEYLRENDTVINASDYVIFQMEIPDEAVYYGIKRAKELGKMVILNPAPAPDKIPDTLLREVDYLTPNETELLKITGTNDASLEGIKKSAELLVKKGVKHVLVTLGSKGCLVVDEKSGVLYPANKVEAVDTTAAGDCFNGALAVGLAESMSLEDAISLANLASSKAVTRKGAQSSIPSRKEIRAGVTAGAVKG